MIIDVYNHILPKKYQEIIDKKVTRRDSNVPSAIWSKTVHTLIDLDARFRIMDDFPGYIQVISVAGPPTYAIADPSLSVELAKVANDELAELVHKFPERFAGGIATLPMNDPDAAVAEAERAIKDLRLRGVEIYTDIGGKPIDSPEFMPLYEKMAELGRPIFIHPRGEMTTPDYAGEKISHYRLWIKLRWPYATALAVSRLVYSGVIERIPNVQIVTHHCGGFIPYLASRMDWGDDTNEMLFGQRDVYLKEKSVNYFRRIFYDTATCGNTAALQCAMQFVGIHQMVFGTDMPFDNQLGRRLIRDTIASVERMDLSEEEKKKIYRDNAVQLLRLPLGAL